LAIADYGDIQENVGKIRLAALYDYWKGKYYILLDECESLVEWADMQAESDPDPYYFRSLAHVVEKVFKYVDDREALGKPVLTKESQTPITVPLLIGRQKLVSKLKENADYFSKLENDSERDDLLDNIVTLSRKKIKAKRAQSDESKIPADLIMDALVQPDPKSNRTRYTLDLTLKQEEFFLKTLGPALKSHLVETE